MTAVSDETGRELEPCPFCAGINIKDRHVRDGRQMYCVDCGASVAPTFHGPAGDTIQRATAAWNKRAALSASPVAQEPVATKKVYIKPLRTIVEIQTAYADQIRDWLNTSPPATPAGLGADEIARVFVRWKKSKNLHESLAAQNIEKELLALLSRAGDQSNSHHEEQSTQNI